jgi:YVTN family beta-propeller protein
MILGIMILALVVTLLPNNAFAQTLHNQTLYELVKQTSGLDKISGISVGDEPEDMVFSGRYDEEIDSEGGILYVANRGSGTVSLISVKNNTVIEDIPVQNEPTAIAVGSTTDPVTGGEIERVYVAHDSSDIVSVISIFENNTKTVEEIPVGVEPTAIAIDSRYDPETKKNTEIVYVAGYGEYTVSVISFTENNTKTVENIPAEGGFQVEPTAIAIDSRYDDPETDQEKESVYVVDEGSGTVSVISFTENNTKTVENIPVGVGASDIGIIDELDTVYVANSDSNSVSVIDRTANKVVTGTTFQINPFKSGSIVCYDPTTPSPYDLTPPSPIGEYIYIYSGTECIAKPNPGFEFVSWEENLDGNSTQPLQISLPASSWDSFVLAVTDFFGDKPDKPEATLNVTKFGTFTANFKELPPAVPSEYWIPLYGIIASTIVGWSIPSIIGWTKSKRDVGKLNYYHKEIASLYGDGKLDENDIEALDRLRNRVSDAYSEGKINEKHYESLRDEISTLYEEIFGKKIESLSNDKSSAVKKSIQEQLAQIRNKVEDAYSKGKINEKHYDLLTKAISNLDSKERDTS